MSITRTTMSGAAAGAIALTLGIDLAGAAIAATPPAEPSVMVFDQKVQNSQVTIDYANLPAKGYIAIYGSNEKGDRSGEPIGSASVAPGDHRHVKITLNRAAKPGERLWASLYTDGDGAPDFKPGKGDSPVWSMLPAENAFTVR